jgi:hypothetical protein
MPINMPMKPAPHTADFATSMSKEIVKITQVRAEYLHEEDFPSIRGRSSVIEESLSTVFSFLAVQGKESSLPCLSTETVQMWPQPSIWTQVSTYAASQSDSFEHWRIFRLRWTVSRLAVLAGYPGNIVSSMSER